MMCVGMFMAILDVQVVATSLPTIQGALAIPPDQMSWVQTAYLIAEVIAIPLTGFLTRTLGMRRLFVLSISGFTLSSARLCGERNILRPDRMAGVAGLFGRDPDPGRLFGGVPAFPGPAAGTCHRPCRLSGGARADGWPCRRRLDHRHLFLALAVSHQRRCLDLFPRLSRRHAAAGTGLPGRSPQARHPFGDASGDRSDRS